MTTITDGYYAGWTYFLVIEYGTARVIRASSLGRLEEHVKDINGGHMPFGIVIRPTTDQELEFFDTLGCIREVMG